MSGTAKRKEGEKRRKRGGKGRVKRTKLSTLGKVRDIWPAIFWALKRHRIRTSNIPYRVEFMTIPLCSPLLTSNNHLTLSSHN